MRHVSWKAYDFPQAKCLQVSLEAQDKCTATDVACICADKPLNAAIQGCVLQKCTVIDALGGFI